MVKDMNKWQLCPACSGYPDSSGCSRCKNAGSVPVDSSAPKRSDQEASNRSGPVGLPWSVAPLYTPDGTQVSGPTGTRIGKFFDEEKTDSLKSIGEVPTSN